MSNKNIEEISVDRFHSTEEVIQVGEDIGFVNSTLYKMPKDNDFMAYLLEDYFLFRNEEVRARGIDNVDDYYAQVNHPFFGQIKQMAQEKIASIKDVNVPTEERIMAVISLIKQVHMTYLMQEFPELSAETAAKLVEREFTHGNCRSVQGTLCNLVEGCNAVVFTSGDYSHQCVEYNGKYYDINGCSSEQEMRAYVEEEDSKQEHNCIIKQLTDKELQSNIDAQTLFDYVLEDAIKNERGIEPVSLEKIAEIKNENPADFPPEPEVDYKASVEKEQDENEEEKIKEE